MDHCDKGNPPAYSVDAPQFFNPTASYREDAGTTQFFGSGYPLQTAFFPVQREAPNVTVVQVQPPSQSTVVNFRNECQHVFNREFTDCGICLAICCFPVGLVCCYVMSENRCYKCGFTI